MTHQRLITDAYTDELFQDASLCNITYIKNPVSRLLCDVERFCEDKDEPSSKIGWGVVYTRGALFRRIRKRDLAFRDEIVREFYDSHHKALTEATARELSTNGYAILLDGHSFNSLWPPLLPKPDFCIGMDSYHTPKALADALVKCCRENGYTARINMPYSGSITPICYYGKEKRVVSVMVEVNRKLYMNQKTGQKNADFEKIHLMCQKLMRIASKWKPEDHD